MTLANAYRVLGASKEDSDSEVKKKYHNLVMQYHPDKHIGGNIEYATQKMQEINAAYECIIQSRSDDYSGFDWEVSVKVTYNRPPRPSGRENIHANIARTTFGYHCDFWNLWSPKEERSSEFCHSLYRGILEKIAMIKSKHDILFFVPVVDRLTYYGAAEYVDPYTCLCERFDTKDISDAVTLFLITKGDLDTPEGSPVSLTYDCSLLGQPYAISFYTVDGKKLGTVQSMESLCVVLLKEHIGTSISGTIESILTRDEYDHITRKRTPTNYITIRLHISIDQTPKNLFGFINNRAPINALLNYYRDCSTFINTFFNERVFDSDDVHQLYHNILTQVQRPDILTSSIYTLRYRVYEGDAHEIDGDAQCNDLTKISLLTLQEKELLCYIYAATQKYDLLKDLSKSKANYYQYDGKQVRFLISLYRQKNPNYEGIGDIKYWHSVRISIYSKSSLC